MKGRVRIGFKFWLNGGDPEEEKLIEEIELLKYRKRFTQTIRDGIRLICSLREGRLDVLKLLFPWVWDQIALELETKRIQASEGPDLQAMHAMLSRIDSAIASGSTPMLGTSGGGALSPLSDGRALKPMPDDRFELEIKQQTANENNNPTWNFMIASTLQIYSNCDSLPDEIIEYGLRTNRIPADKVTRNYQKAAPKSPKKAASKGPKAMDVPQFTPPDFDLDDDLLSVSG